MRLEGRPRGVGVELMRGVVVWLSIFTYWAFKKCGCEKAALCFLRFYSHLLWFFFKTALFISTYFGALSAYVFPLCVHAATIARYFYMAVGWYDSAVYMS